jgi:hypothetical protein
MCIQHFAWAAHIGFRHVQHCTNIEWTKIQAATRYLNWFISFQVKLPSNLHKVGLDKTSQVAQSSLFFFFYSLQTSSAMHSCLLGVDNVDKSGLQAGTANEETVNIGLLSELSAVLL